MKIYIASREDSPLVDADQELSNRLRQASSTSDFQLCSDPTRSDLVIINEELSFKEHRYVKRLKNDAFISRFQKKIFTLNFDDAANGLLQGLYTSLPKSRYDAQRHRTCCYYRTPNEIVLRAREKSAPKFLACFSGSAKSNPKLRQAVVETLQKKPGFLIRASQSWMNHNVNEKEQYVDEITQSKFVLCPGGWAPTSFRIFESMALSRCPVIISDQFVPPAGVPWESFSLLVAEKDVHRIEEVLLKREEKWEELGELARKAWERYFDPQVCAKHYLSQIQSIVAARTTEFCDPSSAQAWSSWKTFSANGWTLPQRVARQIKKRASRRSR